LVRDGFRCEGDSHLFRPMPIGRVGLAHRDRLPRLRRLPNPESPVAFGPRKTGENRFAVF